jgi:hypothetical protein
MKSLGRSQAARRRAAAAAVASLGAGILGTQSAEAEIVSIDLTNVNSRDFTGENAGISDGGTKTFSMSFGAAGTLQFNVKNRQNVDYFYTGIQLFSADAGYQFSFGGIANGGNASTPQNYAFGTLINGSTSNFSLGNFGNNPLFNYVFEGTPSTAPPFDGYLGFLSSGTDGNGTNGVYGWIKATWDGTNFQLYSAAYESTPGLPILAGALPSAVPEIDPSGLASTMSLVMGSLAMLEQRRRKRAAAAVTAAVTA